MRTSFLLVILAGCAGGSDDLPADSDVPTDTASDTDGPPPTDTAPPPDTWDNFAASFMQTYCVECHTGDGKDFRQYNRVVAFADPVRCGVTPTALPDCTGFPPPAQFPVGSGPFPDDAERIRLVDWIDDGALEGGP